MKLYSTCGFEQLVGIEGPNYHIRDFCGRGTKLQGKQCVPWSGKVFCGENTVWDEDARKCLPVFLKEKIEPCTTLKCSDDAETCEKNEDCVDNAFCQKVAGRRNVCRKNDSQNNREDGEYCIKASHCASGECFHLTCLEQNIPDGKACVKSSQCTSNNCVGNICQAKEVLVWNKPALAVSKPALAVSKPALAVSKPALVVSKARYSGFFDDKHSVPEPAQKRWNGWSDHGKCENLGLTTYCTCGANTVPYVNSDGRTAKCTQPWPGGMSHKTLVCPEGSAPVMWKGGPFGSHKGLQCVL